MMTDSIETPCIGLCTLDGQGICKGCLRTFQEIADWPYMSAFERSEIMTDLALRGEGAKGKGERVPKPGQSTDSFER
jgi:predicted Fe-S protein YdhL (DUF1289 family)